MDCGIDRLHIKLCISCSSDLYANIAYSTPKEYCAE